MEISLPPPPAALAAPASTAAAGNEDIVINEVLSVTVSSFVAWHTSMLCVASYAADPIERLHNQDMSANRFTSCFVSDYGSYTGKFIVCDATDEAGQEYLFVCFRGTQTSDDAAVNLSLWQTSSQVGLIHAGFLERAEVFPLVPIFTALQEGKRVVLTGHSLGGACAMVLATKFFNTYGQFDYDDGQVQCVTYGSPLIGDCSVCGYLYKRAQHFHNYILEGDLVPLSLTILNDVVAKLTNTARVEQPADAVPSATKEHVLSYSPFGQFYHLKTTNELLPSNMAPMTADELKIYFSRNYGSWFGRKSVSDHAMDNYKNALLFALKTAVPKPGASPRALGSPPVPTISMCSVKDNVVIVTGANLTYCYCVTLLGYQLRVCRSYEASDGKAFFSMGEGELVSFGKELAVAITEKKVVDVFVSTVFGIRSEDKNVYIRFERLEEYLSPREVLRSMCPLATLLVRADSELSPETRGYFDEILQHCKALSDSVPIEFAFRCMENDTADNEYKFLGFFLKRMTAVQVDWKIMRSPVSMDILHHVVDGLTSSQNKAESTESRLQVIRNAFKSTQWKAPDPLLKVINQTGYNETLVVGHYVDPDPFWNLVCVEGSEIAFSVDLRADAEHSMRDFFPAEGATRGLLRKFEAMTTKCCDLSHGVVQTELLILHRAAGLERHFVHFSMPSGQRELPSPDALGVLMGALMKVIRDPKYLRYTGRTAACVYLSDTAKEGNLRAGLFAFILAKCLLSKPLEDKELMRQLSIKFGDKSKSKELPFETIHYEYAEECRAKTVAGRTTLEAFADWSGRGDTVAEASNILNDHLRQMKTNYDSYHSTICGQSISMLVRPMHSIDAAPEPFLNLFPDLLTTEELEVNSESEKRCLINRAYESSSKADYLSIMLEDSMTFGKKFFDTKREGFELAGNSVLAVGQSVLYAPWAVGKALARVVLGDESQLVDIRAGYNTLWHRTLYQQKRLSSYKDIVDEISFRMGQKMRTASLLDKEKFITDGLPPEIGKLGLVDLAQRKGSLFKDPRFKALLTGGSTDEMTIFFLKTIYHCMHLRRLRRQITLVTVAGEKNAGKTSLNFEIFGEDVVQARMGTGLEETTIYPSAYFLPEHPSVIFCDLPGCSDADTAEMCDLFLKLGDVSVFVLKQNTAANPRAGDPLYDTISAILQCKGPRLICINHADNLLRVGKSKKERDEYNPEAKLKKECEVWAASKLFGTTISSCSDNTTAPKWKCEEAHPNAVVASIRTADGALSVWMTAFDPQVEREKAVELLFGAAHVREWVEEVQGMIAAGRGNA